MVKKTTKVEIGGIEYIPVNQMNERAKIKAGMPYVLIRTFSAGVHTGYLKKRIEKEVELSDSIRIWKWAGAASLSQLAMEGTKDPDNCKFAIPITTSIILTEAIEIIEMTELARKNIEAVESWKI